MSDLAQRGAVRIGAGLRHVRRRLRLGADDRYWNVVTIEASPDEVMTDGQPPPLLAELGDAVEVDVRPAPGIRGTELHARLARTRGARRGRVNRGDLRQALRRTKQLIEVGEVLQSVPRPEGKRPPTPGGKLVDIAVQKSDRKGVL